MSGADPALAVAETHFELTSVVPVDAPNGSEGLWHRYVIKQGTNTITGLRSGTRLELDAQLRDMVEKLNQRASQHRAKPKR